MEILASVMCRADWPVWARGKWQETRLASLGQGKFVSPVVIIGDAQPASESRGEQPEKRLASLGQGRLAMACSGNYLWSIK